MTVTASSTAFWLLALMNLKGIGRQAALKTVDKPIREEDQGNCPDAFVSHVSQVYQASVSERRLRDAWAKTEEQLNRTDNVDIEIFSFHDQEYPDRLRSIPDPPAVLFVKGNTAGLYATRSLAIVGTREPTSFGENVAQTSARTAVECEFVVVSGLAHGCDTYAHMGCVESNGIGVAVLAHGLDKVYPVANRDLAVSLLDNGGCLVSEYPVGMKPVRSAFVERDRIQSGLSDAVFVIETDEKGGTMHTVQFAREQSRRLACIDHPPQLHLENKTRGNQKLIDDGWAEPVSDSKSFAQFLNGLVTHGNTLEIPKNPDCEQQEMAFALLD